MVMLVVLLTLLLLGGCGNQGKGITSGKGLYDPDKKDEPLEEVVLVKEEDLFVVMEINEEEQFMLLQKNDDESQQFSYLFDENMMVYDKYKERIQLEKLEIGDVVNIQTDVARQKLLSLTLSKQVWKIDEVSDLIVEKNGEIASFRGKKYAWSDEVGIFFQKQQLTLEELSRMDLLQIIGKDKKILSIKVTTGHGYVTFNNTEKFQGGYILFGNLLAVQIKNEMTLPIRAGKILLSVMKDGVGGSKEVEISENQKLEVDLSAFSQEVVGSGEVTFKLMQEDAKIYINGSLIDATQPQILSYGGYQIKIKAEGYDAWTRTLMVKSEKATLVIDLDQKESTPETDSTTDPTPDPEPDSKPEQKPETDNTESSTTKLIDDILNMLLGVKETETSNPNGD